tara:strand:+ start:79 stop:210 length:132 start_codon:yes stop_codon:yes gene_type:complete
MKKFKSIPKKIKNNNPIKMVSEFLMDLKLNNNLFDTYPYANIQ